MVNLESKKRVFWEALILTVLIFILGLLIGILLEGKRLDVIQGHYVDSENSLIDSLALGNLANIDNFTCVILINSNIDFANRIYDEARILEDYEDSAKFTNSLVSEHRKYDLMRTLLWINTLKTSESCKTQNMNVVVYVYNSNPDDLTEKAKNTVWSKILNDLKAKHGDTIILIPVAVDTQVSSLEPLLEHFGVSEYPSLIVNNNYVFSELNSVEDIEGYFF